MSASKHFKKVFTKKFLNELYFSTVRYKSAVGIDRVNRISFENNLDTNIDIVRKKSIKGTYTFTPYREKLLLRSSIKKPRVVSIPTIRDKVALKALYEVLKQTYGNELPFVHEIIRDISTALKSGGYDGVIRLDVVNFYPTIMHDVLIKILKKRIKKKEILHLISSAITTPTKEKIKTGKREYSTIGVPQGLSISNVLSNIYFSSIDQKYGTFADIGYHRYVDDILILCKCDDIDTLKLSIQNDCQKIGLELHTDDPDKVASCKLTEGFSYLGYVFNQQNVSVREKSIESLRQSLIKLFTNYKYSKTSDLNLLKWAIDIRITGCIFNDTKYGWLFFFSQINDLQLLSRLDHFIRKLTKRFQVKKNSIKFKKFIRAYHEITKNLSNTTYIPNFDIYSTSKKRQILSDVFNLKTSPMTAESIEYHFNRCIYKTIKDLEKDLARAS